MTSITQTQTISSPVLLMNSMVQALVESNGNTQNEVENLQAAFDQHRNESSVLNTQLSSENQRMQAIIADLQAQLSISNKVKDDEIYALKNQIVILKSETSLLKNENNLCQQNLNILAQENAQLKSNNAYLQTVEGFKQTREQLRPLLSKLKGYKN